ncbi:MAG: sigma-70 family RNA polymerase sigma factor, partial [Muribaculaceae bacterium]|nr:sigma-70 family RNA polymerase sigma factor [Muribaculaceae bacterium]
HIDVMQIENEKERQFLDLLDTYKSVIAKVCCIYTSPTADFDDLYQETVINLWNGFDKFRGDAKISTWIYRAAINTCITWIRRNKKHSNNIELEADMPIIAESSSKLADYKRLHSLIAKLQPLEKAIITLWLDEKSYEEIADITGLSQSNVAVRLHRIKEKMSKMSD